MVWRAKMKLFQRWIKSCIYEYLYVHNVYLGALKQSQGMPWENDDISSLDQVIYI